MEYKVNYLKLAKGKVLTATAHVENSGRRLAVCRFKVDCKEGREEYCCAVAQGKIILAQ